MSNTKKYYWLKLKRDFFKRHDIKIIEAMDNGKDYVLFYLKLLLESIDHEGSLRFSETVPYNEKMLATITDTNIDIVRSAVQVFAELGMMERFDDGTLYMSQVQSMIGSETSEAIRLREIRAKKKQMLITQGESVQRTKTYENRTPEIEIELDKEIEKEIREKPDKPVKATRVKKEFIPPTLEQVESYVIEKQLVINPNKFIDWYSKTDWKDNEGKQVKNWKMKAINWDSREREKNPDAIPYSKPLPPKINVPRRCRHIDSSGNQCEGEIFNSYCKVCGAVYDWSGNEIL